MDKVKGSYSGSRGDDNPVKRDAGKNPGAAWCTLKISVWELPDDAESGVWNASETASEKYGNQRLDTHR